jgi:hypothetical protein
VDDDDKFWKCSIFVILIFQHTFVAVCFVHCILFFFVLLIYYFQTDCGRYICMQCNLLSGL